MFTVSNGFTHGHLYLRTIFRPILSHEPPNGELPMNNGILNAEVDKISAKFEELKKSDNTPNKLNEMADLLIECSAVLITAKLLSINTDRIVELGNTICEEVEKRRRNRHTMN